MDEMTLCMQKIINKLHNNSRRIADLEAQNAALRAFVKQICTADLWLLREGQATSYNAAARALLADLDAKGEAE
jgi:hypothetical protein